MPVLTWASASVHDPSGCCCDLRKRTPSRMACSTCSLVTSPRATTAPATSIEPARASMRTEAIRRDMGKLPGGDPMMCGAFTVGPSLDCDVPLTTSARDSVCRDRTFVALSPGHQRLEQVTVDSRQRQRRPSVGRWPVSDQDRAVLDLCRGQSVAATHQGRVEWDDVEQGAESQPLLGQPRDGAARAARAGSGRRTARTGRIRACGGCPRCGRSRGPSDRPASRDRRTRRRARPARPARPSGRGRGPARRGRRPSSTRATPGVAADRSRACSRSSGREA